MDQDSVEFISNIQRLSAKIDDMLVGEDAVVGMLALASLLHCEMQRSEYPDQELIKGLKVLVKSNIQAHRLLHGGRSN